MLLGCCRLNLTHNCLPASQSSCHQLCTPSSATLLPPSMVTHAHANRHTSFQLTLFAPAPPPDKRDLNNGGPLSTDFIGANWAYPDADYADRQAIWQAHMDYTQVLAPATCAGLSCISELTVLPAHATRACCGSWPLTTRWTQRCTRRHEPTGGARTSL